MGHQAGRKALRKTIQHCLHRGVGTLTVFAFSSENWSRPQSEISHLMRIFLRALDKEVNELHANGICVRFIGDTSAFDTNIQLKMANAEALTLNNQRMIVNIAVNYGGRWDITQAAIQIAKAVAAGKLSPADVNEQQFSSLLALAGSADPDLFIRTGGEMRISNFLLWQSAYTEFYFSAELWPDFNHQSLDLAIAAFQSRERRFGRTGEQVKETVDA